VESNECGEFILFDQALYTSETAGWRALIGQSCHQMTLDLPVEVEHYLVRMLVRLGQNLPACGTGPMAEFVPLNKENLQELASQSLIVSGLFPEIMQKFHISEKEFVGFVKNLYLELSRNESGSALFSYISHHINEVILILRMIRQSAIEQCDHNMDTLLLIEPISIHTRSVVVDEKTSEEGFASTLAGQAKARMKAYLH